MADLEVKCREPQCGKPFKITDGEQQFFQEKGFALPKRCKDCRKQRRAQTAPTAAPARETYVPASFDVFPPPAENQRSRRDRGNRRRRDESHDSY
jgi:hypothetical protein